MITTIGALVRFTFLSRAAGYDETYSYLLYASRSFGHIVGSYYPNNHVLHTLAMKLSVLLLGPEPWVWRIPVFAAGVACIPAVFLLGRELDGNVAGLVAAAFTAGSSPLIEYSTNARGYMIVTLIGVLLLRIDARKLYAQRHSWITAGLLSALGLFTVPTALLIVAGWNAWIIATILLPTAPARRTAVLKCVVGANALLVVLGGLLYLPAIAHSGLKSLTANQWVHSVPLAQVASALPHAVDAVWRSAGRDWAGGTMIAVLSALCIAALGRVAAPTRLLVPATLAGAMALLCVGRVVAQPRMLLTFVPIAYVTGGVGVRLAIGALPGTARVTRVAPLLAVALAGVMAVWVQTHATFTVGNETGALDDGPDLARLLTERVGANDIIVAGVPSNVPLYYYIQRLGGPTSHLSMKPSEWAHSGIGSAHRLFLVVNDPIETLTEVEAALGDAVSGFEPAVLVLAFPHATVYVRAEVPTSSPPPLQPIAK